MKAHERAGVSFFKRTNQRACYCDWPVVDNNFPNMRRYRQILCSWGNKKCVSIKNCDVTTEVVTDKLSYMY